MPSNAKGSGLNLAVETLAAFAGTYNVQENGKTLIAEVTLEGNTLFWNYDGTGKQRLDPVSETTFSLAGNSIQFVRDEPGPATRFVMRTIEDETTGVRRK